MMTWLTPSLLRLWAGTEDIFWMSFELLRTEVLLWPNQKWAFQNITNPEIGLCELLFCGSHLRGSKAHVGSKKRGLTVTSTYLETYFIWELITNSLTRILQYHNLTPEVRVSLQIFCEHLIKSTRCYGSPLSRRPAPERRLLK